MFVSIDIKIYESFCLGPAKFTHDNRRHQPKLLKLFMGCILYLVDVYVVYVSYWSGIDTKCVLNLEFN